MQFVVRHAIQITITPAFRDGSAYTTTAFILRLTKYLLNQVNTAYNWKRVAGFEFADNNPMNSETIDIIIGADLFGMLILNVFERVPNMNLPRKIRHSAGFFPD